MQIAERPALVALLAPPLAAQPIGAVMLGAMGVVHLAPLAVHDLELARAAHGSQLVCWPPT